MANHPSVRDMKVAAANLDLVAGTIDEFIDEDEASRLEEVLAEVLAAADLIGGALADRLEALGR